MRSAWVAARSRYRVSARYDASRLLGASLAVIWAVAGELHRNNWLARAITHCSITYAQAPMPIGGDADSLAMFLQWWDHAGLRGESLDDLYAMIVTGQVETGDILALLTSDPNGDGPALARISLVDGARVRTPSSFVDGKTKDGGIVVHGVQYDKVGREVGYWVCNVKGGTYQTGDIKDYTYYPVRDQNTGRPVAQLLRRPDALSPSSSRGIPTITHIVPQIEDLGDLEDAGVQAAHVRALLSVMLKSNDPLKVQEAMGVKVDGDGKVIEAESKVFGQIEPGTITQLPPGTDPIQVSHNGQSELVALMSESLRHVSGSIGYPLEILLSNFKDVNYSSSKNSWDKLRRQLQRWADSNIVWFTLVYRWVVIEGWLRRGVRATEAQLKVTWSPVMMPDPDPKASSTAKKTLLSCGLASVTDLLAQEGKDIKTHLETLAAEQRMAREMGVTLNYGNGKADAVQQPETDGV